MLKVFSIFRDYKNLQQQMNITKLLLQERNEEIAELKAAHDKDVELIKQLTPPISDPLIPVFSVSSNSIDPLKGVHIELDWNDAFIQYIKDNSGETNSNHPDEFYVEKFLVFLYQDLVDRLEGRLIDIKSQSQTGDYE